MKLKKYWLCCLLVWGMGMQNLAWSDEPEKVAPPNYDEAKVPEYTLPNPLVFADGSAVDTTEKWTQKRRPEILAEFEEHVYGRTPELKVPVRYRVTKNIDNFLDGQATLKEVEISVGEEDRASVITLLVIAPNGDKPAPAFLGLNFAGNHAISEAKEITLNPNYMRPGYKGVVNNRATEECRGIQAHRWPIETLIQRGYALATIYCGDIDPDFHDGFQNGIHPHFYEKGQTTPKVNEWGTIGAWAWGLSRGLDYLERDPQIDASKVAVIGHSRLGKTSLWAGAQDERFALVISNNSGCGGAALSRRCFGETVHRINTSFPHWFCHNFRQYNKKEDQIPVDQHQLISLIAPRPVYIASAVEDRWADPKGEFLSGYHADPVYRLLGTDGLGGEKPVSEMPEVDQPVSHGTIGYHIRSGAHNVLPFDWQQYLDFADRHFQHTASKPAKAKAE